MQIYTKIKVDTDLNVYPSNQFVYYLLPIKIDIFLYDGVKKEFIDLPTIYRINVTLPAGELSWHILELPPPSVNITKVGNCSM